MLHTWIAPTYLILQLMTKVSARFHQLIKIKLGLSHGLRGKKTREKRRKRKVKGIIVISFFI
jgi:hypothetical protein